MEYEYKWYLLLKLVFFRLVKFKINFKSYFKIKMAYIEIYFTSEKE